MKAEHYLSHIQAKQNNSTGFQSAGDDFTALDLNLQEKLVLHPNSTFFLKLEGKLALNDITKFKIRDKILVVDKSLTPQASDLVIAMIEDELCAINFQAFNKHANNSESIAEIWGVVSSIIYCLN